MLGGKGGEGGGTETELMDERRKRKGEKGRGGSSYG